MKTEPEYLWNTIIHLINPSSSRDMDLFASEYDTMQATSSTKEIDCLAHPLLEAIFEVYFGGWPSLEQLDDLASSIASFMQSTWLHTNNETINHALIQCSLRAWAYDPDATETVPLNLSVFVQLVAAAVLVDIIVQDRPALLAPVIERAKALALGLDSIPPPPDIPPASVNPRSKKSPQPLPAHPPLRPNDPTVSPGDIRQHFAVDHDSQTTEDLVLTYETIQDMADGEPWVLHQEQLLWEVPDPFMPHTYYLMATKERTISSGWKADGSITPPDEQPPTIPAAPIKVLQAALTGHAPTNKGISPDELIVLLRQHDVTSVRTAPHLATRLLTEGWMEPDPRGGWTLSQKGIEASLAIRSLGLSFLAESWHVEMNEQVARCMAGTSTPTEALTTLLAGVVSEMPAHTWIDDIA